MQQLHQTLCNSEFIISIGKHENRVLHILKGDYTPLSAVNIFIKDPGIVLDSARQHSFPPPLTATAHQMFLSAAAAGHSAEDDSAVMKTFPDIGLPRAQS